MRLDHFRSLAKYPVTDKFKNNRSSREMCSELAHQHALESVHKSTERRSSQEVDHSRSLLCPNHQPGYHIICTNEYQLPSSLI